MTAATITRPLYQKGDKGQEIALVQQYLATVGFSPGSADGVYGANTENAIRGFQQAMGLQADGVLWPNTFEALVAQVNARGGVRPTYQPAVQPQPEPVEAAPVSPFPKWALYVGLAAAGAIGLYFLTQRSSGGRPAMAGYSDCNCGDQSYDQFAGRRALTPRRSSKRIKR